MKTTSKLESSVIDRIAAGEIIHHPVNAVKELMENSLDAGSKHVEITIKNGGLELIKIKDNGCGIQVDDMPLVCERHATSKLKEFKDLQKINTFGFRGEALASISQIAKVAIISKAVHCYYGYQAAYQNGNILSKPKLCASNYGTMISIQNLFENTPSRRKAIKSPNDEYHKILDCVKKYAVHNIAIGFTLNKDASREIAAKSVTNPIERIQQIYGTAIASCLKSCEFKDSKWHFRIFYSDINMEESVYKVDKKNSVFVLFVNNRLVENSKIKKEIKQVYTNIKSNYKSPFVFISLKVNPNHLDVNIHPTKNQVRLLDKDQIVEKMVQVLGNALNESATAPDSKKKQKTSPSPPLPKEATLKYYFKTVSSDEQRRRSVSSESELSSNSPDTPPASPISIRKKGPLNEYFNGMDNGITAEDADPSLSGAHGGGRLLISSHQRVPSSTTTISPFNDITNISTDPIKKKRAGVYLTKVNGPIQKSFSPPPRSVASSISSIPRVEEEQEEQEEEENLQELESIMTLQKEIKEAGDKGLTKMLSKMQCIGCIDNVLLLAHYKDTIYLMNYNVASEEFFYQTVINQIGKFGKIFLSTPMSICTCIYLKMPMAEAQEVLAAAQSILAHRELLKSYYQLDVVASDDNSDVYLTCLPMMLKGYVPALDKLPEFLVDVAIEINWEDEIDCLDSLAHELASLYCCTSDNQWNQVAQALTQGVTFKAPRLLGKDGFIVQLEIPEDIMTK